MSASRAKGTRAESAVVAYLQQWNPNVERRALTGSNDKGDIAGLVGVVIEVKDHKAISLAQFVDEAEAEGYNANARVTAAWIKRRGKGSPGDWYVAMTGLQFVTLLRDAGYLP